MIYFYWNFYKYTGLEIFIKSPAMASNSKDTFYISLFYSSDSKWADYIFRYIVGKSTSSIKKIILHIWFLILGIEHYFTKRRPFLSVFEVYPAPKFRLRCPQHPTRVMSLSLLYPEYPSEWTYPLKSFRQAAA